MAESTLPYDSAAHPGAVEQPTLGDGTRAWKPRGPAAQHWLAPQRLISEQTAESATAAATPANASAGDGTAPDRITIGL